VPKSSSRKYLTGFGYVKSFEGSGSNSACIASGTHKKRPPLPGVVGIQRLESQLNVSGFAGSHKPTLQEQWAIPEGERTD